MDTPQTQALATLSETKRTLDRLAGEALKAQRYADVAEIARLAEGLDRLLNGQVSKTSAFSPSERTPDRRLLRPAPKQPSKKAYPRFEREGDKLVKIGWSKKAREEYEHRAPRTAVVSFVRHLMNQVNEGQVFTVEDLLPVPDPDSGGELPAYQVYLTLAWLRDMGVVEKRGRDGYLVDKGRLNNGTFDQLWNSISSR